VRRALIAIIVLGAAAIGGFTALRQRAAPPAAAWRPDILLITIDTLRADRVSRTLTPAIDALGESGYRYTNARTSVPLTFPAHVSLMTGTPPPVHGVHENGVAFKPGPPTLARTLKNHGYRTAAFVAAYVLDRRFGLADGFDTYDDRIPRGADGAARLEAERRGGDVVDAALAWLRPQLDTRDAPWFAWVHLYDPHAPYDPPAAYLTRAAGDAYNGEVAYADAQVTRLIEALGTQAQLVSTLVVIAGDHGEGLGEHGEGTHGLLAYDSTLRIPLAIAGAGVGRGVVSEPVSIVDIAPSILARMNVPRHEAASGAHLFSRPPPDRDVYAESLYARTAGWHPLRVLAGDQWKLIESSEPELFDIRQDPGEQRNVAAQHERIVAGMSARLRQLQASEKPAARAVPADAAERLRALGYVSGSAPAPGGDSGRPNPARAIASWEMFEHSLALVNAGRPVEALGSLRELAARHPRALVFQVTYARALKDAGNPREAVRVYRAAIAEHPADAALFHDLAVAARAAGDGDEALRAEQAALAVDTGHPAALNGIGLLHAGAGRPAEAAQAFEQAAAADPTNASFWTNLGNARRELGDARGAEAAYQHALSVDPSYPDAANGLGVMLVQGGRPAEAIKWFAQALQRSPNFHEARLNLGIAYQESGDTARAADAYRQLLAEAPPAARRERLAAEDLLKRLK
jgi:arylsulfatase A-like enzyme/Flp pilus assembly protein TadD